MPTLPELQKQFTAALREKNEDIVQTIKSHSHLTANNRLDIYRGSIIGNLQKALIDIYPVCRKLVGETFYIAMINEYIKCSPSQSFDLACYGCDLPNFIANFEPAKVLPYLPDVARLEWAWHDVYSARDAKRIDYVKLAEYIRNIMMTLYFYFHPKVPCSPPLTHTSYMGNQSRRISR